MQIICDLRLEREQLKSWLYRFAGIFISVFFLYLAVRQVDLAESIRVLSTVQPGWLIAAMVVYLSNFPLQALRWRRILWNQRSALVKGDHGPGPGRTHGE